MKGSRAYSVKKVGVPRNVILWILIMKCIIDYKTNKDR